MSLVSSLIPPVAMLVAFVAVAVTAYRATDGARRAPEDHDRGPADPG